MTKVQFTLQGGRRVCLLQDGEDLGRVFLNAL